MEFSRSLFKKTNEFQKVIISFSWRDLGIPVFVFLEVELTKAKGSEIRTDWKQIRKTKRL
jgi:hypothetical protein